MKSHAVASLVAQIIALFDPSCVFSQSVMQRRWFLGKRVISVLVFCFVLLLYRQACRSPSQTRSRRPSGEDAFEALLQQHERSYLQHSRNLSRRISQLRAELQRSAVELEEQNQAELEEFLQKQLRRAEVFTGEPLPSEFAVLPFETFTLRRVYQLESGLTRLPVENPVRQDRRSELNEVLEAALHLLNEPQLGRVYSPQHFYEGPADFFKQGSVKCNLHIHYPEKQICTAKNDSLTCVFVLF